MERPLKLKSVMTALIMTRMAIPIVMIRIVLMNRPAVANKRVKYARTIPNAVPESVAGGNANNQKSVLTDK